MGIPGLWDLIADCKEITSLAELATKHFEHHKRPLRIAVDEATWRHKLFISNKGKLCKKYSTIHLNERNLITFVLRLLKLNIQLIFVADGPQKPLEKYKGKGAGVWRFKNNVLQECLRLLGVKWHDAPGEAEAECAVLQRRGTVDWVWTEDGDALMFGCGGLVRFCYGGEEGEEEEEGENENEREKEKGKGKAKSSGVWTAKRGGMKDLDRVVLYRADVIQAKHPGFDREGLVLFVLLSGGDYGKGLQDCGVGRSGKVVKMGFGKELCQTMKISGDLDAWRNNLRKYFIGSKTGVSVPGSFPDKRIWGLYNSPVISSVERLEKLEENVWSGKIDEKKLPTFFVEKFNWGIDKYIDYVISILLTQSLTSFDRNGKSNMDLYNLTYMESGLKCKVWYSLFAVTSLGKEWVDKCIGDLNKKRPNHWKRYELPWGTEPTVEGRDLLTCIVKHVMEPDITMTSESEDEIQIEKVLSKSRRRSLSPRRTILEDRTRVKKSRISISPPPTSTPHHRSTATKEETSLDISMYEDSDENLLKGPLEPKPKTKNPSHSNSPPNIPNKQKPQQDHDASIEIALKFNKPPKSSKNTHHNHKIKAPANTTPQSRSTQNPPTNLLSDIKTNRISKTPAPLPHPSHFTTANEDYDFTNAYHIAMDAPLDSDSDSECEIIKITSFLKSRRSNVSPGSTNYKVLGHNSYSCRISKSTSTSHLNRTSNTTNALPYNQIPQKSNHQSDFEFEYEFKNDDLIAMDEPLDFDLDLDPDPDPNSKTKSLDTQSPISISSISKPPFEHRQLVSNPRFIAHSSSPFPSDLERSSDGGGKIPILFAPCGRGRGYGRDEDEDGDEDDVMNTEEDISFDISSDIDIDITTNEERPKQQQPSLQQNPINKPQSSASSQSSPKPLKTLNSTKLKILKNISAPNSNQNPHTNTNPNILLYPSHPTGPYQELDISIFFSSSSSSPSSFSPSSS